MATQPSSEDPKRSPLDDGTDQDDPGLDDVELEYEDEEEEEQKPEEQGEPKEEPEPPVAAQGEPQVDPKNALAALNQYRSSYVPMLRRQIQERDQRIKDLMQSSEHAQQFHSQVTQYGLSPQEAPIALQMAAMYKTNPAGLIHQLIQDAQSKGVDLTSLNQPVQMSPQAIQQMIRAELQPRAQPVPNEEGLRHYVAAFYTRNPDAQVHDDTLGQLMTQYPGHDPEDVWQRLKLWMIETGLDPSKPVQQQLQRRPQKPNYTSRRQSAPQGNGVNQVMQPGDPTLSGRELAREAYLEWKAGRS